ncbi:MAG: hypothetical protein K8W52_19240 [Deltaproteobacteria bacterium]|nr:hypothetical protein [Deltaproteobacteria bacterium]
MQRPTGISSRMAAASRAFRDPPAPPTSSASSARAPLGAAEPLTGLLRNPWLRFGSAIVVGYAAGSFDRASAIRTMARRFLLFAATAIVRDVFAAADDDHPPR